MAKPKIVMNRKGAIALMNRGDVQEVLLQHADGMAARAGSGFVADVQPGKTRAHGMVKSSDRESMTAQAERSALTKAIRG